MISSNSSFVKSSKFSFWAEFEVEFAELKILFAVVFEFTFKFMLEFMYPCEFSLFLVSFDIFLAFEFRLCKFAKFEFVSFKFVSLFVVLNFATFSLKFYPKLNFYLAKNSLNSFLLVRDFS